MNNDILVVRVNMLLKNKEQESVHQYIFEQRKTGFSGKEEQWID